VRDGVVSHRGEVVTIERFDLWFSPPRPAIPIYVAALFPRLLEIAGELAEGVLLTWPTPSTIARAVEHVAIGARRVGRSAVDVASLIPCAVAETAAAARDVMRPAVGLYAGFFPRYNRLLAEAGFADRDGDGIVESAAGRPFRFILKVPHGNRERADIAQVVQADLRRVGVEAAIQEVEFNALLARASDPAARDFDAMVLGWKPEFRVDDSDLFACAKRDNPMAFSGYCSPATDRLIDSTLTLADRRAALPVWRRYQRRIAADQPFTLLYFANRLQGVSRRVQGAEPDARGDWVGVERWWILPSARGR
ncbi:MAG TPA: LLM class flavin-dependent oxidoreductase, partial [Longimicrobiaceae bacterium]|nr:LLM class flavin-dependent oxidoreductase [Longimicrobiaceae bacterium]